MKMNLVILHCSIGNVRVMDICKGSTNKLHAQAPRESERENTEDEGNAHTSMNGPPTKRRLKPTCGSIEAACKQSATSASNTETSTKGTHGGAEAGMKRKAFESDR